MDVVATPLDSGTVHVAVSQEPQTLDAHFTLDEVKGIWEHLGDVIKKAEAIVLRKQAAEAPAEEAPVEEQPAETPAPPAAEEPPAS
jgi:hypothetical protein